MIINLKHNTHEPSQNPLWPYVISAARWWPRPPLVATV